MTIKFDKKLFKKIQSHRFLLAWVKSVNFAEKEESPFIKVIKR